MYIPFLRGRMYELQALQDLSFNQNIYEGEKILPLIEPADFTKPCLKSYFKLASMQTPFILMINPVSTKATIEDIETKLIQGTLARDLIYYLMRFN